MPRLSIRNRLVPAFALLTALVGGAAAPVMAAGPSLKPPDLDYSAVCAARTVPPQPLDRDWTQWKGEAVTTAPDAMFAIAGEYLRGSDRVKKSIETGMAMLTYLETSGAVPRPRIDRLVGKALVTDAPDTATLRQGEARLLAAYGAGVVTAAADLAKLYGPTGPAALRDPAKARQYTRASAASGDVDGQLAYARILAADPATPEAERNLAISTALLSMIQAVSTGECRYMPVVAQLYLRGELVAADTDTAIAWLEQYAETGDALTAERLGNLLVSNQVAHTDAARSIHYLEAAALKGRPAAALTVGMAYANGTTVQQDPVAAEKFFRIAADGKQPDAEQWLARLYAGEFGGAINADLARQHFEAAMATSPTPELQADYGRFLATSANADDQAKAVMLLQDAAARGVGQAAVQVGRLAMNASVPAIGPTAAGTYFRLAAELGKPEGARQMAKIAACGIGMSPSAAESARWTERAFYLGATTAMVNAARADLANADPAIHARGITLMKQAAFKGVPEALAYIISRSETGTEGFAKDQALADRLVHYIDVQGDPEIKLESHIELIKARLSLAQTDADRSTQMQALDTLVATGAPEAAQLKGDILHEMLGADPAQITALYAKAAEAGDKRALRDYAQALDNNPATKAEARQWLQKAADAGDVKARITLVDTTKADAMTTLDTIAGSGIACSTDERIALARAYAGLADPAAAPKARQWLEAAVAVSDNSADDLYKIADAYRDGIAGTDQVAKAEDFFSRSAAGGRGDALREVANGHLLGLWTDSTPEQAKAALDDLLASGDPKAADLMVRAVASGQIKATLDDIEKLLASSSNLSKQGDTYMKLVTLDEAGTFGTPHPDKQSDWLQKAADGGNTQAMMRLYRAYAAGIGVGASPEAAAGWLMKAAEGGDSRAAGELAAAYDVGFGVPIDPVKAAYWRDRAGAQG